MNIKIPNNIYNYKSYKNYKIRFNNELINLKT